MTDIDWARIARELQAPFPETEIKTKPGRGGKPLSYVDRSLVAERLDAVVGPENWHFDWLPMVSDAEQIRVVKGTLTIYGISKSDVGDSADGDEPNKSAVSDAFKRVAALWGVARYLARKSAPAPAPGRPQEPRPREQPQEPRNGREATPSPPPPARAARAPAGVGSESTGAITDQQQKSIRAAVGRAGMTMDDLLDQLDITSLADLSHDKAGRVIDRLNKRAAEQQKQAALAAPDPNAPVADTPRLTAVR